MAYDRRADRRGGRQAGGRADRPPRDRDRAERPPRDFAERPPRDFAERPPRDFAERPARDFGERAGGRGYAPRPQGRSYTARSDDGGMSIRLDPRRLSALKLLAAEAGVRPGELVTHWVEERLDAARAGTDASPKPDALRQLSSRLDELTRRVDALTTAADSGAPRPSSEAAEGRQTPAAVATETPKRRPGRPRKQAAEGARPARQRRGGPRVPLHEEIAAVIAERGPLSASELAQAITERGRYLPPRSGRALDAPAVNSRVSNPVYRARFTRSGGRIGLAEPA
ncbi:MAG TPA: hypothetical protein VF013_02540 [Candidatus Limnocylindria bacterium]